MNGKVGRPSKGDVSKAGGMINGIECSIKARRIIKG